jgi:hypothetical protein
MRLTSLTISTPLADQPPSDSNEEALEAWWNATRSVRTKGWTWHDLSADQVSQAIQAFLIDYGRDSTAIAKMVTSLLYELPDHERSWAWAIPLSNGKVIRFTADTFIETPRDSAGPAVAMEVAPETPGERAELALMGVSDTARPIHPALTDRFLSAQPKQGTRSLDPVTLTDVPVAALTAELDRVDQRWPKAMSTEQLFLVAGPLAMWLKGVAQGADTSSLTLHGLSHAQMDQPEHAACRLTVTYS